MKDERFKIMRDEARDKIKKSGLSLFSTKGFSQVSVSQIAVNANVSVGLMYRYYKSKQELFDELVDDATSRFYDFMEFLKVDLSPLEIVTILTENILNSFKNDPDYSKYLSLMALGFLNDTIANKDEAVKKYEKLYYEFSILIEKGQKNNVFKQGNPIDMAVYFFTMIQGISIAQLTRDGYEVPSVNMLLDYLVKR